jgi:MFS family permease
MGVATFSQGAFGVLASDLIAEFGLDRWQIGILLTANGFTGALLSPLFGRVTDRKGGVRSVVWVLVLAMVTMIVVSASPNYFVLVAGAVLYGLPNGWANPATNALIVDNVVAGARGVITGVKQSGVQMGTFLGGLLLPGVAAATNWRVAFASFLIFPVVGLVGMWRRPEILQSHAVGGSKAPIPTAVRWIAVYGMLAGLGVAATTTFLPLFAHESEGWTTAQAGMLIAGVGLVGVAARITWGSASERWLGHGRTLRLMAVQSAAAAGFLALASANVAPSWVLVPAALLMGSGVVAWNVVGMLAVMDYSAPELVGRGTGLIMLGFLTGLGLGPPLMGLSVDRLGAYTLGWVVITALFVVCAIVARKVNRS